MHFFNPATLMKLVEVVAGAASDPQVCASLVATAQAWGKVAIPVADVPGFIVNRVARPYYAEAFTALAQGAASAEEIDALFRGAGFKMGPLELTDLIGQDINFAVAQSVFQGYFGRTRFVPQLRQGALVDAGWLGRKTGRGVYAYPQGPQALADEPAPDAIPASWQAAAQALQANPQGFVACDGALIGRTRGATARRESCLQGKPVVLLDEAGVGAVAYALSDDSLQPMARGIVSAMGQRGLRVADRAGLIVARNLAQIANAAADAVLEQVADEAGIDAALRYGANYPFGPFAWADRWGRAGVVSLLEEVARETGEAMYQPSSYLRATA
jgi:3-hydroxybutyryl-CoA dehydrogenase